MSQSINKIHSNNLIQPSNDEDLFIYNGYDWVKTESKLYKSYDKDISEIDTSSMNDEDYVLMHKSVGNMLLYSENFNKDRKYSPLIKNPTKEEKSYWVKNNISINSQYTTKIPYVYQDVNLLDTMNEKNVIGRVEHSIEQIIYKLPMKKVAFSCFVKLSDTLSVGNIALSLFSDTYNIGISAIFNLNSSVNPKLSIVDKNFSTTAAHLNTYKHLIKNTSVGVKEIIHNNEIFYRIYIIGQFDCNSQFRCKLNILNDKNEFKYESSAYKEKYSLYISGFQLETMSDNIIPNDYITTKDKEVYKRIPNGLYKLSENILEKTSNKVQYFDTLLEHYDDTNKRIILDSYSPTFTNLSRGDVGVMSSIISFTNTDIEKNKKIINRRNNNTDNSGNKIVYDDISNEKQQEMLSESALKLGSMENGDGKESNFPLYSIYYDKSKKEYRINMPKGFAKLNYKSIKSVYKSMVKAMTFNQGYFETWCEKGKGIHKLGFNTGGNYNFWKLNRVRH